MIRTDSHRLRYFSRRSNFVSRRSSDCVPVSPAGGFADSVSCPGFDRVALSLPSPVKYRSEFGKLTSDFLSMEGSEPWANIVAGIVADRVRTMTREKQAVAAATRRHFPNCGLLARWMHCDHIAIFFPKCSQLKRIDHLDVPAVDHLLHPGQTASDVSGIQNFSRSPVVGESMHASPISHSRRWGGVQRPSGHLGYY